MTKANRYLSIGAAAGMLLLILDGQTALIGAREGIDICIRTVIPSLFPFFVLSIVLTQSLNGSRSRMIGFIGKLFGAPEGSAVLLITGMLGGYPVGAQCIRSAYDSRNLDRLQAQRMLRFCNQAGPAFLFGMVAQQFPSAGYSWLIWVILLLSALFVAHTKPQELSAPISFKTDMQLSLPAALQQAIQAISGVCGWIILFRILLTFLDRWILWILPSWLRVLVSGLLELSNGCLILSSLKCEGAKLLIASILLSFGGLCVLMQTVSVLGELNWQDYLAGKLLQSVYAANFGVLFQIILPPAQRCVSPSFMVISFLILLFLPIFIGKSQKTYGVSLPAGV